ncbi:hypothetical protein C7S13_5438 [Burkholderia cepacia]|nr:hypothetical protein [Burkholderia cepacia]MDW9249062.1 hypothetical protein [Burkholderia cepacia]QOH38555.1 hypothetical protein C7S14_3205 [Burkholderia cepacia]
MAGARAIAAPRDPPCPAAGGTDGTGEDTSIRTMKQTQYSSMQRCKCFMT